MAARPTVWYDIFLTGYVDGCEPEHEGFLFIPEESGVWDIAQLFVAQNVYEW